ncbi:CPBP family intramembrane glutamic endopeptidase [Facklamia sp. 7083-14-GEN3]|uniref:CPBP family intramembrane glutamic endopeptidase n=1 Tax=Facklamia sp. 7083-14-GEN3 TaxID=2973478 RepID=UPI00215C7B49|nr:CPBP family intramembrane glutamic endopeptidase [Facklamia sp. 7083-14-GEN3]MCR8969825.1 CPBP family intramembrane metalloprotease [Facklamia sp. 7083-14-GEN3]
MNWPLNQSMQLTQKQAGKRPLRVIGFTALINFLGLLLALIISLFLIGPLIYMKFGDSLSTEDVEQALLNEPIMVYSELFLTITTIIATLLLAKWLQGRKLNSFAFYKDNFLKKYGLGIVIAAALMIITFLANLLMGTITVQINPQADGLAFILLLIGFMVQGMSEEILLRGYLMNGLAAAWGVPLAILINSIFFSLLHYANPGITVLALVNIALAGIFFSLLFYITDNMWLTGAAHSFWNFIMGVVFGVQVSGLVLPGTLLITESKAEASLINGGDFGFEGGLVVTIILIIACIYLISKRPKELKVI